VTETSVIGRIAAELGVRDGQVTAAVQLLDGGATVPFIARYRKEVTGTLDDAQLRTLEERLRYLRELEERRAAILASITEQGKLTDELAERINGADTKARLEDLYLPYKPKRRTKAQIARENGLEPLADLLLTAPENDPATAANDYLSDTVPDVQAALDGARAILVERFAEDADLIGALRERMWSQGVLRAQVREGKEDEGRKYSDYFDFAEPFARLKAHRVLAMFRAEKEEILDLTLDPNTDPGGQGYEQPIAERFGVRDRGRPADRWLLDTVTWAWRTRVLVHLGIDLRMRLWQAAEAEAVDVFAANLRDLLLAAPAGQRATMGLDPGFRTGVKVAVLDQTGKVTATHTIYPHVPQHKWDESLAILAHLAGEHHVELIAIGNGTASRETDKLAMDLIAANPGLNLTKIVVSEAGASVYSASAYASSELPELDVSLRGAVSIARRLQDPLAELVKIDPKSIGVGQYQHDVTGSKLERSLDAVVEDCVNAVGVDVNTASRPLLARVSGITDGLAAAIVAHRDASGAFAARQQLMTVPRLGPKAFEQCAGFLRIRGGDDPLDASGVHPESYPVVRRILAKTGTGVAALIGDTKTLRALSPAEFTDAAFGLPTVSDILKELEKPGRDPRPEFRTATFAEGVHTLDDLEPGMVLEGVVTNVAAFGAFVDVGVHQDGLVHVSAMSASFVSDPRSVAKPGDVVRVKVLSVDTARQRISLTMRLDDGAARSGGSPRGSRPSSSRTEAPDSRPAPASPGRGAPRAHGNSAPRPDDRRPGKPATDRRGPRGDDQRGPRPDDRRGAPGGARAGARPDDRRGGPRRDDRPGQHDDDRRSPRPDDRRGAHGDDRRSPRPDDRRGAPAGDDRRGGPRPDDRRDGAAPPPSGAMAEALRRAGLLDESGAAEAKPGAAKPHRRDDRP
jgi:protein Tex